MILGILNRRIRGVRLVNLWGVGLLLVLVVGLYLMKTFAGGERADIDRAEAQIADEQHKIRLLQAEVAYLEQPERIGRLSQQYLGLQPTPGKHEAKVGDLQQISHSAAEPRSGAPKAATP